MFIFARWTRQLDFDKTMCKSHPFPGISFQALQLSNTVRVKQNTGGLNIVQRVGEVSHDERVHGFA